jgi:DNA-binding MarR family transcriptional regulator
MIMEKYQRNSSLDFYLKTSWQATANTYNQIASLYGLTQASGFILIHIHQEGTSVSNLASLMGVKATSLSRLLNQLEGLNLIYRKVNEEDRRSMKVYLTPLGCEKREIAKQVVRSYNDYLLQHISPEEHLLLQDVLKRITRLAGQYREDNLSPCLVDPLTI